jgi:hypothetical protein
VKIFVWRFAGNGTNVAALALSPSPKEIAMKRLPWPLFTIVVGAALNGHTRAQMSPPAPEAAVKDPVQLCQKLAGTEREICLRKAQENPAAGGAAGATPGTGSTGVGTPDAKTDDDKRGNTPPGKSRGGDPPAAGAIVDPDGVTKR